MIVLDLDDTLYPERDYARSGLRAAAHRARELEELPDLEERMLALFDAGQRGTIFNRALTETLGAADPLLVEAMVAAYRAHEPEIALFEDAVWALDWAGRSGPMALLTDGYHQTQMLKVVALGIVHRFHTIVYTDALGGRDWWKPNPAGFEHIEKATGGSRLVYVADNPRKDFIAPNHLGWLTVRVLRPEGEYAGELAPEGGEPQRTIASLRDLPDVLW